jgi:hypothetical protein
MEWYFFSTKTSDRPQFFSQFERCTMYRVPVRGAHASHRRHSCHMIRVSKEAWYRSILIPPPLIITVRPRVSPIIVRYDIDEDVQRWLATFHFQFILPFFFFVFYFLSSHCGATLTCVPFLNLRPCFVFLLINVSTPFRRRGYIRH